MTVNFTKWKNFEPGIKLELILKLEVIMLFCSCSSMIYGYTNMVHSKNYANFDFQKCLMFGSLISATDPGKNILLFKFCYLELLFAQFHNSENLHCSLSLSLSLSLDL